MNKKPAKKLTLRKSTVKNLKALIVHSGIKAGGPTSRSCGKSCPVPNC